MEKTIFIFISCCVFLCYGYSGISQSTLRCNRPNEINKCVLECPPEKTCKTRNIEYSCLLEAKPCQEKCICRDGFFRNPLGDCVSRCECERCKGPNEFFACDSACDNECASIHEQNRTNCPIKNIVCNKKCYCEDGYARDSNKICVPVEKCEKRNPGPNEVYTNCKKSCPPETCFSIVARFKCDSREKCKPGFVCKPGYLRLNAEAPCMSMWQCPELANSPDRPRNV